MTTRSGFLKTVLCVAVLLACIASPAPPNPAWAVGTSEGPSIEVRPSMVREFVEPGRAVGYTLAVSNTGDHPVLVEASVRDLALSRRGLNVFLRPGEPGYAWGAGSFLATDVSHFTLAPGEVRKVTVTGYIPASVRGSRYGAVLFKAAEAGASGPITLSVETGTLFAFSAEGTLTYRARLRLRDIEGNQVVAEFVNMGNTHVTARLAAELFDSYGRLAAAGGMAGGTGTVLPSGVREYTWDVPKGLPDGSYRLRVTASFDGGRRADLDSELRVVLGSVKLGKAFDGEGGAL